MRYYCAGVCLIVAISYISLLVCHMFMSQWHQNTSFIRGKASLKLMGESKLRIGDSTFCCARWGAGSRVLHLLKQPDLFSNTKSYYFFGVVLPLQAELMMTVSKNHLGICLQNKVCSHS